jgi:exopolysaccharide biosynthesis polyprenyl glycosylphosphotransferase
MRLGAVAEQEPATIGIGETEERVKGTVVPWPGTVVPAPAVEEDVFSSRGAFIDGADVAQSPRDSARRRLLAVADMAGILVAYLLVWVIHPPIGGEMVDRLPLLVVLPGWVLLNKLMGLYDRDDKLIHKSTLDEIPGILHSLTIGSLLVYTFGGALMAEPTQRAPAAFFWLFACFSVPMLRALARTWVRVRFAPERCLIVGSGSVAEVMARKLAGHPEYGMDLIGFIDGEKGLRRKRPATALPMLGDVAHFTDICREHGIERVVVAFSAVSNDETLEIIRAAKRAQIKITIVPRLFEVIGHSVVVDEVEGMTVLSLRGLSRARSSLLLKRAIDVVGAGLGLILLSPVLLAIALAIKLDSRGPVFFRQRRTGRHADFGMMKFRTMVVGADKMKADLLHLNEATGPMFKIERDPRITSVGRFLRKTSLDELPQLWNVLRGEMSLVGPRPLIPDEDDHVIGWHRTRLELTPGLTGPWQVAGRTAVPFEEMVKMDYLYVAEWSLWNDIRLLLRTMPVVLLGRGA